MLKPFTLAAMLTTGLFLVGPPAVAETPDASQQSFRPPRGAMIAPGKAADLVLLYTGDAIGYIDPCG
jgi:hypothetical protein